MVIVLAALIPLLGAALPPLAARWGRDAAALAAGCVTLAALVLVLFQAPAVFAGEAAAGGFAWVPALSLTADFRMDGLGLLFAGLILGMGLLIIAWARSYLAPEEPAGRFHGRLLLFQGAMLGIVLSDNLLLMLVFWELTSLASFLLIGFWKTEPESRRGARLALAITGGGGLALLAGLLLLGEAAGTYQLSEILLRGEVVRSSPLYGPALALILIGCFTKSAQVPFHFWLPAAMAAPTPVSAYLHSATMVKAGIFVLARLWPVLSGTEAWFFAVAGTGLATLLLGGVVALFQRDLKAILAYSTISQLGLIVMLLGFGTPLAVLAAMFHIINHALFKAALFMTAGIVDHAVGTRDAERLGGLARLMPLTAVLTGLAALAMAGVPLLNGFISKEMMLEAALHAPVAGEGWLLPALATAGALLSAGYAFRYVQRVFLGPARPDYPEPPHDPGAGLWAPPAVLVALVVALGLAPALIAGPLVALSAGAVIGEAPPPYKLAIWHGFTPALALSAAALAGGALLAWRGRALQALWDRARPPAARPLFEGGVQALVGGAGRLTRAVHNGSLQRRLAWLVGTALVVGFAAFASGEHGAGTRPAAPLAALPLVGGLLLMTAAGLVVALQRRRFLALILIGVAGLIVSLGFAYLSAPDLALTQIAVEVVTVILLLLALNLLPKETPRESARWRRARDLGLAGLAGLGMGTAAWAVSTREGSSISSYHLAKSYSEGGGTNVVNVTLVDFRGFDTFGEIIVLAIAGLAVYAMLESPRGAWTRRLAGWTPDQPRSPDRHPLLLVVATRVLLPFALAVGAYVFLRGHNQPGGGFVAGLIVSIALIMQYMASGWAWAQRRQRISHHGLIGAGLLLAGVTGLGALAFGRPFLTSAYGYLQAPLIGDVPLSSALAFDAGVLLTVVGAVMLALAQLAHVAQRAEPLPESEHPMDIELGRGRAPEAAR